MICLTNPRATRESFAVVPAWLAVVVQIIAALLTQSSCWQDWCFCLDIFYGYRFRIWIYVQPWDRYVFQRMLVPPSVSWVLFTEISGRCRAASTVGLSLWLEAFWSLLKENAPICLACLSFFLPMKDNQAEFFSYGSTPRSLPGMDQASPVVFTFPQAMSSSALCSLFTLFFLAVGKGENEKRIFCLLGVMNPVGSTLREGKRSELYI